MPTLEQIIGNGRVVQRVIAERMGLDPSEVTSLGFEVNHGGVIVTWESRRTVDVEFVSDCLTQAANERA